MIRKIMLICSFIFLTLIFMSCSNDQATLNEQLNKYIQHWKEEQFEQMYEMVTDETKNKYTPKDFIERYKKIYDDIKARNLSITYDEMNEREVKEAIENKRIDVPITVSLDSIAGNIEFTSKLSLERVEKDKKAKWQVVWNPGLIFPELKDGGQIQIQTTEPKRGEILDRNQMPLAINDHVYEIGVIPKNFVDRKEEIKQIASLLGISASSIEESLKANWVEPHLFVPLKKIPPSQEHLLDDVTDIPSVTQREVLGRTYPLGRAAAHLTGYVGKITDEEFENVDQTKYTPDDDIGKRGLEQLFESDLKGEKGYKILIKKDDETTTLAEKEAKDGKNIVVTIDINVQETIFDEYGPYAGTAAAIHPKTGEVLALISSPAFDPNDFLYGISDDEWKKLQDDPQNPLVNRFSSTFAPGSVIKPITAAIGLTNGTIDPDEHLQINGLKWGKEEWNGYEVTRVSDPGVPVDLKAALSRSDNIYFAMQSVKMGNRLFTRGLERFGFTKSIPFKYPIQSSPISNEGHLKDEILLANTSYGQGEVEVTPLHMALMYTPFINDGHLIKPTLLLDDEKHGQIWHKNVMNEKDAKLINETLRTVVTNGTATVANVDELKISGKTGTAELKSAKSTKGRENGWFVGYPTESEDILIAMMVENVQDSGASSFVANKVKDILIKLKQ